MTLVLHDADVAERLSATDAVRWMGEAVDAQHRGEMVTPPRGHLGLGDGSLVVTAGRRRGDWYGYRTYDTFGGAPGEQVVIVHDEVTGLVRAASFGLELGRRRVGGIGGVAAAALAAPGPVTVGLVGSGFQAWAQIWAISAARRIAALRVFSRDESRRESFAAGIARLVDGPAVAVATARDALDGASVVILATNSPEPVIEPAWVAPAAYIATLGPKQQGRAEFGVELADAATLIATDSPAQLSANHPPHVLHGTPHEQRVHSLGAIRAGEVGVDTATGIRLFLSVGLAGTETFLLDRLAATA